MAKDPGFFASEDVYNNPNSASDSKTKNSECHILECVSLNLEKPSSSLNNSLNNNVNINNNYVNLEHNGLNSNAHSPLYLRTNSLFCVGDNRLFPSVFTLAIFLMYMALFIAQGILIKATNQNQGQYAYNVTTVVLLTECCKLVAALFLFFKDGAKISDFVGYWRQHSKMILYYMIPAGLYAVYNNLTFLSLSQFDPTTYFVLLQFRVVVTGVIFQCLFQKKLSRLQWLSLFILTFGCIIKEYNHIFGSMAKSSVSSGWTTGFIFIFLQIFCSCFAGVYNEYLLKAGGKEGNLWFQNCCMYIDSILCNLVALIAGGNALWAFSGESLIQIFNHKVIAIILTNTAIGIVTALFLKNLNSILKTFASALELVFTAVLCWIIFNIPIDIFTILAIATIGLALFVYAKNPIQAPKPTEAPTKDDEESDLLIHVKETPNKIS